MGVTNLVKAKFRCPPVSKDEMSHYWKECENEAYRLVLYKSERISDLTDIFPLQHIQENQLNLLLIHIVT